MISVLDNNFLLSDQNTIVYKVFFFFGDMYRDGPTYAPKETCTPLDNTQKIKKVYII